MPRNSRTDPVVAAAAKTSLKDVDLTVARAAQLLDMLQGQERPVSLRSIVEFTGLSQTGVFRLLATLEGYGLVQRYNSPRGYGLGWKLAVLAGSLYRQISHMQLVIDTLNSLTQATGESSSMFMLQGSNLICTAFSEGTSELVHRTVVGRLASLTLGAAGRSILAFLPTPDLDRLVETSRARYPMGPSAEKVLRSLPALCAVTRLSGLAVSIEETAPGVAAMGSPIFGAGGGVIGSINIAGPLFRWNVGAMKPHAESLRRASEALSGAFGDSSEREWEDVGLPFDGVPRSFARSGRALRGAVASDKRADRRDPTAHPRKQRARAEQPRDGKSAAKR